MPDHNDDAQLPPGMGSYYSDPIPPTPTGYDPRQARPAVLTAADMPPASSWLSRWLDQQSPIIKQVIAGLVGALMTLLTQWTIPITRPPATEMIPSQQAKIESGAAAAVIVTEVFGE